MGAWVWFDPPPDSPPVVLVNMIHFGTHEYYDEVQAELDRAAVVFIEGIRGTCGVESAATRPAEDALHRIERFTADLAFELRLVTQRDRLIARPAYLCADWTQEEFRKRVSFEPYMPGIACLRETVQRIVDEEAERLRRQYPELSHEELASFVRRGPLRRDVAERLAEAPEEHAALIRGRNEAVLRSVLALRETGVVAICYGADHGPHLARSLEAAGWRRQTTTWHRVFGFDRQPHPDIIPLP